jgi:hypothetical protein
MPPSDAPKTCALGTPATSSTAAASSAIARVLYGGSGALLRPMPRLSIAITKKRRESARRNGCECRLVRP